MAKVDATGLSSLFEEANGLAILTNINVLAIVCAKAVISANGETKNITYGVLFTVLNGHAVVHEYIFS